MDDIAKLTDDENDGDDDENSLDDEMELLGKINDAIVNVRRASFIQLLAFFILLIVSGTVSKRYAWTKAVKQLTFLFFNLESILWFKTFSSIYPAVVGIYSWYHDTFQKSCLKFSLYHHFLVGSSIDMFLSISLFFSTINSYHHKVKSVMPFMYYVVIFLLSLLCIIGNIYTLIQRKLLLLYDDDEYGGGIYSTIRPGNDEDSEDDSTIDKMGDELETKFDVV
jgi:hypothetical protein